MGDTLPPTRRGMPRKECHVMDERLRFVARLLEGEKMAPLCVRVRDFAQNRLQDLRPLQRLWRAGLQRSESPRTPAGESTACAAGSHDRALEARVPGVGRAENP